MRRCELREGVGLSMSCYRQAGVGEEEGFFGTPHSRGLTCVTDVTLDHHLLSPDTFS